MSKRLDLFYRPALVLLCLTLARAASPAAELLPPGYRPRPLGAHALVGGTVVVRPGEVLPGGTVVIRDGLIAAVGTNAAPPADARVWDMKGTTIYAGFIDPYLVTGATNPPISTAESEPEGAASFTSPGVKFFGAPGDKPDMGIAGPGSAVVGITPEHRAVREYSPKEKTLAPLRELGFTAGVIAPSRGIIRGTSALVVLSEEDPNEATLKPDVFQHINFETQASDARAYPGSLMGVIAAVRQSFLDVQHYALDHADYQKRPQGRMRPQFNPAQEALAPAATRKMPVVFEPGSALMVDRAARLAREFGLDFCVVSCGQEWRRPDLVKTVEATFIVPLEFPTLPSLPGEDDWEQIKLDQLRAWDWAAENPAVLRQQGRPIALTTYGLADKKKFRSNLRLALERGLSETDALAALTTVPAQLCGVQNQLGTVEPGKLANLTVVEGKSYFEPEAKVREVWIDGRIYRAPAEGPKPAADKDGRETAASSPRPTPPEEGMVTQPARPDSPPREVPSSGTTTPSKEEPEKKPKPPEAARAEKKKEEKAAEAAPSAEKKPEAKDKKKEQLREAMKARVARSPQEGRGPILHPPAVLIENATIWLCDEKGTVLTNSSLLVKGGRIAGAGRIEIPSEPDLLRIDGRSLDVTPGIIDAHSHTAILGNVNESSLPSTAMVRISDVVNSETDNLYKQLAGGVTLVNLYHGSANPIGGHSSVIKLRDGASPTDLIFDAAPPGIKFALGENVKQSNWGEKFTTRFPQTRMGVRTFIANRLTAARQYLAEWAAWRKAQAAAPDGKSPSRVPPRRDLELEALGEVLEGKRWIHCHAYRQDEILMLMRLMESFGVRVGSFEHVLEGYKVADEIAKHGAAGSTFSDWWAYKFEVYDAIPHNGSLMRDRGVLVSFNSDSSELARRLYTEAAKAVQYGGTPQVEALKFVTLNPAKQLRIQQRVGSLEKGKDADFALWSKSPLDSGTVCLQTWIEGRKYFDRSLDSERTARLEQERKDLIAKAKKVSRLSGGQGGGGGDGDAESFFRTSLEHEFDGQNRDAE